MIELTKQEFIDKAADNAYGEDVCLINIGHDEVHIIAYTEESEGKMAVLEPAGLFIPINEFGNTLFDTIAKVLSERYVKFCIENFQANKNDVYKYLVSKCVLFVKEDAYTYIEMPNSELKDAVKKLKADNLYIIGFTD